MALDFFTTPPRSIKPYLAITILRDVVPTILDESQPITKRIAIAYTFIKVAESTGRLPPQELRENPSKWSSQTFYKIAEFLIQFSIDLIRNLL